jgi:putative Mg2+ transporter-C (MgtC) family protein
MADFFDPQQIRIVLQILLAAFLGCLAGIEREYLGKAAGARTFALVSLSACLFTIISREGFSSFLGQPGISLNPSSLAGSVITGIGFLGAGLIIFRGMKIEGLTTASGLWAVTAIGMAVGCQMYLIAIFTTVLVLLIFAGLRRLHLEKIFGSADKEE